MQLPIELDSHLAEPLQNQLYEQLRALIISKRLKPNSRLIATRFLAESLGVSRTTVLLAYERLIAEGYVETRPAVGTFVCGTLPDIVPTCAAAPHSVEVLPQSELRPPVFLGPSPPALPERRPLIDFWNGPDFRIFPLRTWQRITQHVLECFGKGLSQVSPVSGVPPLKQAISEWLASHRGIVVDPEQVIVVTGCQQAHHIAAQMFLRRGDRVVVEWPCPEAVSHLFDSLGAVQCAVPVDENGIDVDHLPSGPVTLAYVTPSHQNPLGGTLPTDRRERLIQWARQAGAYLIDNHCDGECRYRGMGPPSLKSLDPYGLVLCSGSFASNLGAGLRLGYLVVPQELVPSAVAVKTLLDQGNPWLEQMVLAEFIASGEYDRHLRRVRKVYMERRDCLIGRLQRHFGEPQLFGTDAGYHVTWLLPSEFPSASVVQDLARQRGIGIYTINTKGPLSHVPCHYASNALVLGYSSLDERQIQEGVDGLAAVLMEHRRKAAG